jgi:AbiU2
MWIHHSTLFEGSPLRRELLQEIAPTFFADLNALLIEHLILQICAMTDREESMGRKNLTVKFLIAHSDFSSEPMVLAKLERLSDNMHAFSRKIRPARNRFIGHLDREKILQGASLGGAPRKDWEQFWLDLQDFLEIIHKHYVNSVGHFYLSGISLISDADSLVKALKESTYFCEMLDDNETTRKSSDVAFNSKYFEA